MGETTQAIRKVLLHEDDASAALSRFGPVWEALQPHEQARLVRLVVEKADYDRRKGTLSITFHPTGVRALADEIHAMNTREKTA